MQKNKTLENGIAVRFAHLHPQGHAQTMIYQLSLKDYKKDATVLHTQGLPPL